MKNEEKESFFNDIKGTFLEKILSVPIIEIEREIRSDDTVIGEASLFEKKCFLFYLSNYPPTKKGDEPLSFAEMLKLEMQAMEAISIMRLIIAERLNVLNQNVRNIWICKGGVIVVSHEEMFD